MAINQHNQELDNDIPTRLFHIASHDLKSPLGNLRLAEHLLRERLDDEESVHILDMIRLTLDNMQTVINNVLEVMELQRSPISLNLGPVALREVALSIFGQYEYLAQSKQIEFEIDCEDEIVHADEKRLSQILSNLISNAIKYSPYGTHICLSSIISHQDRVRIVVADEGPGIKEEERQRLFTEFGRLSSRPTGNETSTGLGLWIVKQLTELLKGRVGADFPDEGGSHFWVELPMWRPQN